METKFCCMCKQNLPRDAFSNCSSRKDGKQTMCILCKKAHDKEYFQRIKDERKQRMREKAKNLSNLPPERRARLELVNELEEKPIEGRRKYSKVRNLRVGMIDEEEVKENKEKSMRLALLDD